MTPQRIQRRRTKGWRMPENALYVGRPSKWGNQWTMADAVSWEIPPERRRQWLVNKYRADVREWWPETLAEIRVALAGKNLVCWCPLDQPCHADVLLEIANGGAA